MPSTTVLLNKRKLEDLGVQHYRASPFSQACRRSARKR